ncbi:MAG TPA: hypothetical protein VJ917_06990 [Saprospiraceae bacterium]|nr:hypothetical protein [Saprospiraceae bacterium]
MKKYIILSVLFSAFALFQLNAQQDDHANLETATMTADKAAAADDNIEKSVCAHSGTVSYHKTSTCPMTGKVSKQPVEWNEAEAKFVSMSEGGSQEGSLKNESTNGKKSKSCSKKCAKKCGMSKKSADASTNLTEEAKKDVKVLKSSSL